MILKDNLNIGDKYIFDLEGISNQYPHTYAVKLLEEQEDGNFKVECLQTDELISVHPNALTSISRARKIYKGYINKIPPPTYTHEGFHHFRKIYKLEQAFMLIDDIKDINNLLNEIPFNDMEYDNIHDNDNNF